MKTGNLGMGISLFLSIAAAQANDYPTQARVEYVISCMNKHGGESYDTLYPCVCAIDQIAERLPYDRYVQAETLSYMIRTPGERGGAFRDAPGARKEVRGFANLKSETEQACFVNQVKNTQR